MDQNTAKNNFPNMLLVFMTPNSLSPASRAAIVNDELIPAMNRWAIFVRPLRGLTDKASFMNNAG